MYQSKALVGAEPIKKLLIYPALLLSIMLISSYYFLLPESRWYSFRERLYFLIFSTAIVFLSLSVKRFIIFFLRGKTAQFIGNSALVIGNGVAAFVFLFFVSQNENLKLASAGVIMLTLSIIIYRLAQFYKTSVYGESVIIASSYIIAGLSIEFMYSRIWPKDLTEVSDNISIRTIVILSFISIALLQIISLIDVTGNEKLCKISVWFKTKHIFKFFSTCGILFLLTYVRRGFLADKIIVEWIFIFVVLLIVFTIIIIKLNSAVKSKPDEILKKHLQKITFDKIKDISSISAYVNEFISTGKKSGLTSYLLYMAYRVGIPILTASKIIAPIVEYRDIDITSITSRKEYKVLEERNRQKRTIVIEKVTSNLEFYGRGRTYEHRSTSGNVHKNN
ncbi:UNVERIFIED_CONTAM: hypothetical protein Cloal_3865 [Acetivibrio alkalicellulosi]